MIIVRIREGLGNQMFEYAYAYSLSKRMKRKQIKVYLDMRKEAITSFDKERFARPIGIHQFKLSLPSAPLKSLKNWDYLENRTVIHKVKIWLMKHNLFPYKVFKEEEFNYRKEHLLIQDNTYIEGWFQQYRYFERYRKELLEEFTLKENYETPEELKQIMKTNQVISVHIRRGDYVTNPIVRKSMYICGENYYRKAVDYVASQLENPYLFIFTNDEKWVKDNMQFTIPSTVISNHYQLSDIQELVLMSRCNHNVIANSTFSWWGAWLNEHTDKVVVAPRKWFVDKKRKNIALKEWVKI